MYFVFFTGTAGSGKTSLVKTFQDLLNSLDRSTYVINLDPAVESMPYVPNFDVRQYVDVYKLQASYGLGPNGALVAASEMLISKAREIGEDLNIEEEDVVLVDTPGQIELFAFRDSVRALLSIITDNNPSVNVFLMDSVLSKEKNGFLSIILLASSVRVRMNMPQIDVFSKADLLTPEERERLTQWMQGEGLGDPSGRVSEYFQEIVNVISQYLSSVPVFVSNREYAGVEDLYARVENVINQEMWEEESEGDVP